MNNRILTQNFFRRLQNALESSQFLAFCRFDGLAMLRPTLSTDLGFLPFASATTAKYFHPTPSDVYLLNDPYSGGSSLSDLTFLGCVAPGWFVVDRLPFLKAYRQGPTIDHEGLRIPPTPLVMDQKVNGDVLTSISGHPFCDSRFEAVVLQFLEPFRKRMADVAQNETVMAELKEETHANDCIEFSTEIWRERLRELAVGESQDEVVLDDRTRLRIKSAVRNGQVHFDFSGSSASGSIALTARATASVCASTVLRLTGWTGPIHTGLMDCIQMQTPADTIVNAKFPAAVTAGLRDGATLLATLAARSLHKIDPALPSTEIYPNSSTFHLAFDDAFVFSDSASPGSPATAKGAGLVGFGNWNTHLTPPSVEELEEQYPILFRFIGGRHHSAGKGLHEGGAGVTKIVELLKPAQLIWNWLPYSAKSEGSEGGKAGAHPEILVQKKNQKKPTVLTHSGEMDLQAGDEVVVSSAGAGGYGEVTDNSSLPFA
jgi:N-methylhydantoinase B